MTILSLLLLLATPGDAKVAMLEGQSHSGQLTVISATEVAITENGAEVKLPLADVLAIDFPAVAVVKSEEPQLLTLIDGTELHGSATTRTARQLTLESASLGTLTLDSTAVKSVRLQADNPAFRDQWNTFLKRDAEKDLLIVAKRDGSGLDFLSGVISSISAEKTDFLLDGEAVPVPAARVYGVVFAKAASDGPAAVKATARITSASGDTISAKSFTLAGDKLQIESGWGQTLQIPLDRVRNVDLSSGRIQYLSDLEPLEERFDRVDPEGALLAGLVDKEQQKLLFGPRRDTTMERQSKLRLRGREFSKGLCIHSRTEISWALDGRYSALEGQVGIDDEVAFNGTHATALKITADGNVLFEKLVATGDEPLPLRLPLDGVSTLTVLVDFGDGDSICDWLDLADAKLVIAKDKQ